MRGYQWLDWLWFIAPPHSKHRPELPHGAEQQGHGAPKSGRFWLLVPVYIQGGCVCVCVCFWGCGLHLGTETSDFIRQCAFHVYRLSQRLYSTAKPRYA
jgi:hypothetical protein